MTREEAIKLKEKHGTVRKAAKVAGMRTATFSKLVQGKITAQPNKIKSLSKPAKTVPADNRTLADFRREHDQAWKIRDGLKRLFGGQVIMTDAEFREAVSGNPSRWRAAADMSEFKENRYRVGGELLWASKETVREMRKIRGEAI